MCILPDSLKSQFVQTIIAASIGFVFSFLGQAFWYWLKRTELSLSFTSPKECRGPFFGCVYWLESGNPPIPEEALWVRVHVKNKKKRMARSCRVFLNGIEKQTEKGFEPILEDTLPLKWSFRSDDKDLSFDIPGLLDTYCDVFLTKKGAAHFEPINISEGKANWPKLLMDNGTYRLKVVVGGNNLVPQRKDLYIRWQQQWDDFEVGEDTRDLHHVRWAGSSSNT